MDPCEINGHYFDMVLFETSIFHKVALKICNVKCATQINVPLCNVHLFFCLFYHTSHKIGQRTSYVLANKTNDCFQTGFVLVFHCLDKHCSPTLFWRVFILFRNSTNQWFTSSCLCTLTAMGENKHFKSKTLHTSPLNIYYNSKLHVFQTR